MIISSKSCLCCSVFVSITLSVVFSCCVAVFGVFHDLLAVFQLQLVEIMLCFAYFFKKKIKMAYFVSVCVKVNF